LGRVRPWALNRAGTQCHTPFPLGNSSGHCAPGLHGPEQKMRCEFSAMAKTGTGLQRL